MQIDVGSPKRLVFLFILATLLFAVLYTGYDLIYVEKMTTVNNNLQAFPRVQPKDLPDADISMSKCVTELQSCVFDDDCNTCSENTGKFKCTTVERDGQYEINGIKVQKGNWCLPKVNNDRKCNRYTGKWVWSTSSDCPPDENGVFSSQCWKCVCLYPDLFYDETDCSTQIACINTSDKTFQTPDQQRKGNRLVGAPYSPFAGQYWDPTATQEIDSNVLNTNPYATDAQGRPLFYCNCDARDGKGVTEFLRLPNDPYTCHVDMCYNVGQKLSTTYSCTNTETKQPCDPYADPRNCKCSCNCGLNSTVTRPDGTCQVVAGVCNPGRIKDDYSGCECGVFQKRTCRSNQKNKSNTTLPECKDKENPFGEECVDPCGSMPCGANSTCVNDQNESTGYYCLCSNVPLKEDAEGKTIQWRNKGGPGVHSCDAISFCADEAKIYYGRQGTQTSFQTLIGKSGRQGYNTNLCGRGLNCCHAPGKYMYEWDNTSSGNDSAWLRCLREDEKDYPVGKRDGNVWQRKKGWIVLDHCDNPKMNCQYEAGGSSCLPCDGSKAIYAESSQCCATDACLPGGAPRRWWNHVCIGKSCD